MDTCSDGGMKTRVGDGVAGISMSVSVFVTVSVCLIVTVTMESN